MSYKSILEEFDDRSNGGDDFNLRASLNQKFDNRSPLSTVVNFDELNEDDLIEQLRSAVIYNLYRNANFGICDWPNDDLEFFFDLFRAAEDKNKREIRKETLIARLIALLHLSKGNICLSDFSQLFLVISSIRVVTFERVQAALKILKDKSWNIEDIFHGLMRNDLIQEIASTVVYEVSGKRSNYNLSETRLYFFEGSSQLISFSGQKAIYVNCRSLNIQFSQLKAIQTLLDEDLTTLFKLHFIRLCLHEVTHLQLQSIQGDLNASTPTCLRVIGKDSHQTEQSEPGVIAEIYVLGQRVDLYETSRLPNFKNDVEESPSKYLKVLLKAIEDGVKLNHLRSLHENEKTVVNNRRVTISGLNLEEVFTYE